MAPDHPKADNQPRSHEKLSRLPQSLLFPRPRFAFLLTTHVDAKIHKRALLRPPIPSPYAGASFPKVVYIRAKTPIGSITKRVTKLLHEIENRASQSSLTKAGRGRDDPILIVARAAADRNGGSGEEVMLKASGKAIPKAMQAAGYFSKMDGYTVRLGTASVIAVDDIDVSDASGADDGTNKDEGEENAVPETRVRQVSVLEVAVGLR